MLLFCFAYIFGIGFLIFVNTEYISYFSLCIFRLSFSLFLLKFQIQFLNSGDPFVFSFHLTFCLFSFESICVLRVITYYQLSCVLPSLFHLMRSMTFVCLFVCFLSVNPLFYFSFLYFFICLYRLYLFYLSLYISFALHVFRFIFHLFFSLSLSFLFLFLQNNPLSLSLSITLTHPPQSINVR